MEKTNLEITIEEKEDGWHWRVEDSEGDFEEDVADTEAEAKAEIIASIAEFL